MGLIERSDAFTALYRYFREDCGEDARYAREYAEGILAGVMDAPSATHRGAVDRIRAAVAALRGDDRAQEAAEALRRICDEPCPHQGPEERRVPMCPDCAADARATLDRLA